MLHMWVMDAINVGFLVASMLFWWPIVGVDPIPHWQMSHGARMTNLLIGIPVESFLALALMDNGRPAASMYSLAGTHSGAVILWFGAELFTMVALIPVLMQWLRLEERKGARYAPQLDVQLSAEQQGPGRVHRARLRYLECRRPLRCPRKSAEASSTKTSMTMVAVGCADLLRIVVIGEILRRRVDRARK